MATSIAVVQQIQRLRAFHGDPDHEADCHSANEPEREIRDAV
jgi:hypothetical protein